MSIQTYAGTGVNLFLPLPYLTEIAKFLGNLKYNMAWVAPSTAYELLPADEQMAETILTSKNLHIRMRGTHILTCYLNMYPVGLNKTHNKTLSTKFRDLFNISAYVNVGQFQENLF
jgi:hypothetical protein